MDQKIEDQFNFPDQEIDQKTYVGIVPISTHQSLAGSRIVYNITQQSQQNTLMDSFQINTVRQRGVGKYWRNQRKKQARMRDIETKEQLKIIKQCTFKPKTNEANKSKRDFKQFLETQQAYSKKVKQKIDQLRKNKQNVQSQPRIQTKRRQKISKNKIQNCVFDRLIKQKQKYHCNLNNRLNQITFQPSISERSRNITRQQPIDDYLYKDALARKEKHKDRLKTQQQGSQKTHNVKNQEYIAKKFLKQFKNVIQTLQITNLFQEVIQEALFIQIMNQLGFVTMPSLQYLPPSQADMVNAAYQYIYKIFPNAFNIFTFLLAIIGVSIVDPFRVLELDNQSIEQFNQILLCLNENESRLLHGKYELLYRNRLCSKQKNKQVALEENSCTFSPKISPQSKFLASKHRKVMLEVASKYLPIQNFSKEIQCQTITHPEFLMLNKKVKDIQLQLQRTTEQKRKLKQCTFMPKVNNKNGKMLKKCPQTDHPMLVLNVNFGDKEQQIILKRQYANCLPQLTKYYAQKHRIDEQSQNQLFQMLKNEFIVFFEQFDPSL